jgi:hypothetical protein
MSGLRHKDNLELRWAVLGVSATVEGPDASEHTLLVAPDAAVGKVVGGTCDAVCGARAALVKRICECSPIKGGKRGGKCEDRDGKSVLSSR